MLDDDLERVPDRGGAHRPLDQTPEHSVERLLTICLEQPEHPDPDTYTPAQRDLLDALRQTVAKGLRDLDPDRLLDLHRSAYVLYETLLGHPLAPGARHERSAWFNAARTCYERAVLDLDLAEIAHRLPAPGADVRVEDVHAWFLAEADQRDPVDQEVERYLDHEADLARLTAFIQADGYLNYRFYDALVLAQPHFMESVKHEISVHMWDECGEGEAWAAHTLQFTRSLRRLGLDLPAVPPWQDWRPYAGHNLYFVLATNRRHYFKSIGSLAMPELFDVRRDAAVVRGLERLGFHPETDFEFFFNHVEGDADHGPAWLDGVVDPIVAAEPEAGRELMIGGALRMLAMRRYNAYLAERIGLVAAAGQG